MATDLFDPAKINEAVGSAFGIKMQGASHPFARAPEFEGMNPELRTRLDAAREEYRKQYGKELPITSGVRTREDQQRLYDRWKAGDPNIFMPLNPADFPGRKTFHDDAVDIPSSIPETFLNQFGIHRPLGKRDPVHATLMDNFNPAGASQPAAPQRAGFSPIGTANAAEPPRLAGQAEPVQPMQTTAPAAGQTPGQLSIEDLMKPEAINAAVSEAFGEPPKKGKVSQKVTELLRGSAALADTIYGVVPGVTGMVTYAGARAVGQSPEEAAATQAAVTGAIDRPFGKAFGITETPEYKGEASQRLMQFIGENIDKGADWISQQTGMPKSDVQYYMELGATALPFSKTVRTEAGMVTQAAKTAGGKVLEAAKDITPAPVQRGVTRAVEAVAPGTTTMPTARPTLGAPGAVPPAAPVTAAPGRASIGAAGVPDATIIRQALQTATPEFQQLYGNMPLDKVNAPVVLRHLEGDSLPIPVRLTEGQATGDVVKLSREQNLRGTQPEFAQRFNQQNQQLVDNVPLIRERVAPDVYATKTIESSQSIIDAYKALEDAAGGQFPVDGVQLATNAERALAKKLKTDFLPAPIKRQLDRFKDGEPMTFEQFEAMRTNLAAEIRKAERSGDGNAAMAASIVREALENLPLKGEAAALKPLADTARGHAKARFDALKKDPAYKAAIDESVPADKFFDKFVINGVNKNINTMVDTLGRDSVAHQHMKAGTINWLSDKAGIVDGKGNFSQANYNKALKKLDDVKNFEVIFDPEGQLQLRTLGNVAAYTQFQPRGSFVNNSNTLVGYLANKAAGGLEQTGNIMGLKTFGYPIGSEARRVIRSARERREAEKALKPGAGSTLEDVSKKGQ